MIISYKSFYAYMKLHKYAASSHHSYILALHRAYIHSSLASMVMRVLHIHFWQRLTLYIPSLRNPINLAPCLGLTTGGLCYIRLHLHIMYFSVFHNLQEYKIHMVLVSLNLITFIINNIIRNTTQPFHLIYTF